MCWKTKPAKSKKNRRTNSQPKKKWDVDETAAGGEEIGLTPTEKKMRHW
jgi:hypothetical protein